jgi:hypothetical protein
MMVIRSLLPACAAGLLPFLGACQTAPLGGTKWQVVEVIEPDPEDRAQIEANIKTMKLEFTKDGRIITTTTRPDGKTVIDDRGRYSVDGEVVTIDSPDFEMKAMYRFEGDQLRLHSKQFVVQMDPVKKTAQP